MSINTFKDFLLLYLEKCFIGSPRREIESRTVHFYPHTLWGPTIFRVSCVLSLTEIWIPDVIDAGHGVDIGLRIEGACYGACWSGVASSTHILEGENIGWVLLQNIVKPGQIFLASLLDSRILQLWDTCQFSNGD